MLPLLFIQSFIFPALWLDYIVFLLEVISPPTALAYAFYCLRRILWFHVDGDSSESLVSKIPVFVWTGPCRLACHNFPLVSFSGRSTKKTWGNIPSQIPASKWTVMKKKKNPAAVSRVAEMTSLQLANAFFTRWTGSLPSDVKWISLSRIVNLSATGCATSSCRHYSSREVVTMFPSLALLHCLENNLPTPSPPPPPP